ncbi:hypothetical protein OH76DRAFT_1423580, partial [Lentinus brumalis]
MSNTLCPVCAPPPTFNSSLRAHAVLCSHHRSGASPTTLSRAPTISSSTSERQDSLDGESEQSPGASTRSYCRIPAARPRDEPERPPACAFDAHVNSAARRRQGDSPMVQAQRRLRLTGTLQEHDEASRSLYAEPERVPVCVQCEQRTRGRCDARRSRELERYIAASPGKTAAVARRCQPRTLSK